MPLGERQPEAKVYALPALRGLVLDLPQFSRPAGTFQVLDNFELTRRGVVRKFRGIEQLVGVVYDTPITSMLSYLRGGARRIYGLAQSGTLYNLLTGEEVADVGVSLGIETRMLTFDGKDGADTVQYVLLLGGAGQRIRRWDPAKPDAPAVVGCSAPATPVTIDYAFAVVTGSVDALVTPYVQILVSRQYRVTYWNPTLRHDSSPSPVTDASTFSPSTFDTKAYLPNPPLIHGFQLRISSATPTVGEGYTHMRLWATRDGGEEFFLVTDRLGMNADSAWPLTYLASHDSVLDGVVFGKDSNNSFLGSVSLINRAVYPPSTPPGVPTVNPELSADDIFVSQDVTYVEPAPTDTQHDPPPPAVWGTVYQNRLFLVDAENPAKLVFSEAADFNSFPADNFIVMLTPDGQGINTVESQFASLIVGRSASMSRITGVDFIDFTITHLDAQLGVLGRRLMANLGGALYFLSQEGLERFAMDAPDLVSHSIDPLIQQLLPNIGNYGILAPDSKRSILMLAGKLDTDAVIVLMNTAGQISAEDEFPFSLLRLDVGQQVTALSELLFPSDETEVIVALDNKRVYKMYAGNNPISAQAVTNPDPQDDYHSDKVFHVLRVEPPSGAASDLTGFQVRWSVDGGEFSPLRPLQRYNRVGVRGRTIRLGFTHITGVELGAEDVPMLGDMYIEYVTMDEGR